MAKDIILNGTTYQGVASVQLPTANGLATFYESADGQPVEHTLMTVETEMSWTGIMADENLKTYFEIPVAHQKGCVMISAHSDVVPNTNNAIKWIMAFYDQTQSAKTIYLMMSVPTTTKAADDYPFPTAAGNIAISGNGLVQNGVLTFPSAPSAKVFAAGTVITYIDVPFNFLT